MAPSHPPAAGCVADRLLVPGRQWCSAVTDARQCGMFYVFSRASRWGRPVSGARATHSRGANVRRALRRVDLSAQSAAHDTTPITTAATAAVAADLAARGANDEHRHPPTGAAAAAAAAADGPQLANMAVPPHPGAAITGDEAGGIDDDDQDTEVDARDASYDPPEHQDRHRPLPI